MNLLFLVLFSNCAVLNEPIIRKDPTINQYRYAIIPGTESVVSAVGSVYGNQTGVYGSSYTKSVNPGSMIEGFLLKRGIIVLSEPKPDKVKQTFNVRYGESGRRLVAYGLAGYTIEVTIAFLAAETDEPIYLCTAEGQGSTEVDDIREAVERCLSGLE
jgi:hypothetical protein